MMLQRTPCVIRRQLLWLHSSRPAYVRRRSQGRDTLGQQPTIWAEPGTGTLVASDSPKSRQSTNGRYNISGVPCGFKGWALAAFILSDRDLDNGEPITRA